MGYVAPSSPQSIGGVLDQWLRLFRESFSRCWALAALATAAVSIVIFFDKPLSAARAMSLWQQRLYSLAVPSDPQGPLALVLVILIELAVGATLFAAQVAIMRGKPVGFTASLITGLRRYPHMLAGFALMLLTLAGACLVISPLLMLAGLFVAFAHIHRAGSVGYLLGLGGALIAGLAAVAGVLHVTVRIDLWQVAIFSEDHNAPVAIGRSWRLVKGNWWRTMAILLVAAVVINVFRLVVPSLVGLAIGMIEGHTSGPQAAFTVRLIQVFSQTTRVITLPLTTSLALTVYHDLKLRREGEDLVTRMEALSSS